jgi:hypothetical protein
MGEVTTVALLAVLRKDNPDVSGPTLQVYADALRVYHEASDNIRRLGSVVSHPRTAAPMENPYLKVQTQQGKVLARLQWIRSDRAYALLGGPPLKE